MLGRSMKDLKNDLNNGLSKEEAFENFLERGGNTKKGSRLLANTPCVELSAITKLMSLYVWHMV